MNYFLDFEAAPSGQIISIGCVTEYGETFYTLVRQSMPEQIPPFLTKLTGISNQDLKKAPSLETACKKFYDFIINSYSESEDKIRRYHIFGDSDISFLECSIDLLQDIPMIAAMTTIKESMIDFQRQVKSHYGKKYRLIELYNCLNQTNTVQKHNALQDAIMLKEIYGNLHKIKDPENYKTQADKFKAERCELNFGMQTVIYDAARADKEWLDWPLSFSERFNIKTKGTKNNYFIKAKFPQNNTTLYFATLKEALLWLMKYDGQGRNLSSKKAKNYVNSYYALKKAIENKTLLKKGKWSLKN